MNRDINETKFSFKAFRNLKKGLGEFDAVVECNEIAIREFIDNHKASHNPEQFIQELSEKHGVRVDTININLFASRIRLFYILSVAQQGEQFFEEFIKEYKTYYLSLKWQDKIDGETDFDYLLKHIFTSKKQGINEIGKAIYEGLNYYRLVRNKFTHSERNDIKKLNNLSRKLNQYKDFYSTKFHSHNSPNNYEDIDFNDFLLFTNILKHIGYTLCKKCKPNNIELAKRIANLEIKTNGKIVKPINNIKKLENNHKRFLNAIGNLLNSTFGKINNTDRDEIIKNLKKHSSLAVKASPPRK